MAVRVVLLSRCRVHGRVSTLCVRVESEAELTAIDQTTTPCRTATGVQQLLARSTFVTVTSAVLEEGGFVLEETPDQLEE